MDKDPRNRRNSRTLPQACRMQFKHVAVNQGHHRSTPMVIGNASNVAEDP